MGTDYVVVDGEQYPALEGELILASREVERLRAKNAQLREVLKTSSSNEEERLRTLVGKLEAEMAAVTLAARGEDVDAPKSDAMKAVLAMRAQVERLRAENAALVAQQMKLIESDAHIGAEVVDLRAENAKLREQMDRYISIVGDLDLSKPEGT